MRFKPLNTRRESVNLEMMTNPKLNMMSMACIAFLIIYLIFFEWICQAQLQKSSLTVFTEWIVLGDKTIPWFIGGILIFLIAMALFGQVVTTAFKAKTGTPSSYMYVGNQLGKGDFIYSQSDDGKNELYVPRTKLQDSFYGDSFRSVYKRKIYFKDGEGTLTDSRELMPGRMLVLILSAAFMIFLSFAIVGKLIPEQYKKMPKEEFIAQILYSEESGALEKMAGNEKVIYGGFVMLFLFMFGFCFLIVNSKMSGFNYDDAGNVLPLPNTIFDRARVKGKVVLKEAHHRKSTNTQITSFYRGFCIKFDSVAGFDTPVYVNWVAQKYNADDLARATGKLRKEFMAEKEINDGQFESLETAMSAGSYYEFQVDKDLFITPIQH